MSSCAVLVPVLNRPERLYDFVHESDWTGVTTLLFLASQGDTEEHKALAKLIVRADIGFRWSVMPWRGGKQGDYARKINRGVRMTEEPWLFLGADDLRFHEGWFAACMEAGKHGAEVIGTNDLGNPLVKRGGHSTHSLVSRAYVERLGTIDKVGDALHEGYWHNWVDNEFVGTARSRGEFVFAKEAHVEHRHWLWNKSVTKDSTYEIGEEHYFDDQVLYLSRRHLWGQR